LVAVQPMIAGHGEAFIGIKGESELGPVVAFGMGGIFVEVMKRVGGRMAPMAAEDAAELIQEFNDTGVLDGFRGSPAWDRRALSEVLVAASRLAAAGRAWIESMDINPLTACACCARRNGRRHAVTRSVGGCRLALPSGAPRWRRCRYAAAATLIRR